VTPLPLAGGVGGGGQHGPYFGENTVDISQHIVVPEAQHSIAARFDLARPARVGYSLLIVLTAVELDREPRFATDEVDDERTD
jgi:hypothetical protein